MIAALKQGLASAAAAGRRHAAAADSISLIERLVYLALALSMLALYLVVRGGDHALIAILIAETGWIEQLSPPAWWLLAVLVPISAGLSRRSLALALLCVLFGMRELDLHQVVAGTSFLKINFYRSGEILLQQKLLGGTLALLSVGAVLYALALHVPAFVRGRQFERSWGRIVLLAVALLCFAKFLDRLPAMVGGYLLDPAHWKSLSMANLHEEWFELFAPLALCAAVFERRRTIRATATHA
jgi:hypothetical protein